MPTVIEPILVLPELQKLATNYKCRCIEVSAILNHKVDDLLVGMLKQIQGRYDVMTAQSADGDTYDDDDDVDGGRCSSKCADDSNCMTRTKENILGKLCSSMRVSKSLENLLDL